jgi:peptide-methionine (R)-S-oxide reductase
MNRRALCLLLGAAPAIFAPGLLMAASGGRPERLRKSADEWRGLLPADAYAILFEEETERPFTSPLNDEKRSGTYVCAACRWPLFESRHKYDSGTGWPSFTQPIRHSMGKKQDYTLFRPRTEYHCARCGGHQGHVFDDGPKPRGERWCNNGLALAFVPEGEPLPPLVT